jgi:hypothetical protein
LDFAAEFGTETPSKVQTDAWLAARTPIALQPSVGTAFKNNNAAQSTYNHLFVYYSDPSDDASLILSDDGADTVSTASAASLGTVRGAGDASVDANGDLRLNANVATDTVIGNRTLADNAASGTLISIAAKTLTSWLQGIRNNLKDYFAHKANTSNPHSVTAAQTALSATATTALGLPDGTTAEAALIAINQRKNYIINMDSKIF